MRRLYRGYIIWDIAPYSPLTVKDICEEYVASIFMVEEQMKQKPA
jgi:hypothetical protein